MPSLVRYMILVLLLVAARPTMSQRSRTDTLVVHFAFDRSDLRPADSIMIYYFFLHRFDSLRRHGAQINGNPSGADSVRIYGYTDTIGSRKYNLRLSQRRADALTQQAIEWFPQERVGFGFSIGLGESNPIPNSDSLSRRAEVILYYTLKDTPVIAKTPPVDTPRARPDNEPDTAFSLDNINFIANTPTLTDAARDAMPHAVAYLRNFNDRYLEIDGFCNQPGPPLKPKDPLFILSVERAKYIYNYLIQQGFDSTHLRYKGLGNATPMVSHPTTKQEMDQNMRVQVRVFRKPQPQLQQ